MPPKAKPGPKAKARGKAKAKAKVFPKAKARAKARVRGRLGRSPGRLAPVSGGVKRRPALDKPEVRGEEVAIDSLGVDDFLGKNTLVLEGLYYEAGVKIAGKGCGVSAQEGGQYLTFQVEGTMSESLLQYLSGTADKRIVVHLCGGDCSHKVWREDLVHLTKATRWKTAAEDWMGNAREVAILPGGEGERDELRRVREEAIEMATPGVGRTRRSRTRSPKKKKKKEEAEEKKEKEKPEGKKLKVQAEKSLEAVLGHTGLDPSQEVRKRFIKRARKLVQGKKYKKKSKKRKSRKNSSSPGETDSQASKTSSSSSSQEDKGIDQEDLFGGASSVRKVSQEYPGVLTASWIRECQRFLLDSQGQVWTKREGSVPPLAVQFFRNQMHGKMSPPMAREYVTIAFMIDLMLQGRIPESADIGVQRLKSLLSTHSGVHYSIAQKLEIIPADKTNPASLEETQEAARLAREESRVLSRASKPPSWSTSYGGEPFKGGKGKDGKGKKGKSKEGKGKDSEKGSQGDQKRG